MSASPSDIESGPLVSVAIPTLNEQPSISICLESVLAQTWRNVEVLVVDGGSTDRTRDLVEAFAAVDPRVRLLDNPRRTQPAALNRAVDEALGEYLIRIDAHSTVPPTYVEGVIDHFLTGSWGGVGGRKDGVAETAQGHAIAAALGSRFGVGGSTYHHGTEMQT
ncbi:MAG: glycosyltransferase, partial [Microthrixaceae bacterium]